MFSNTNSDFFWMEQALHLAKEAQKIGEVPVGAVLVSEDNQLYSKGYNQVIKANDPSAHAEIVAIRQAAKNIHNYRLLNTTLYVTLEPCAMCAGCIVEARIKRVVFATRDLRAGACGSVLNLLKGFPLNHYVEVDEGILQQESAQLLQRFFKSLR